MKVIVLGRGKGKTHQLIKLSAEKFYYIVCPNRQAVEMTFSRAQKMELNIPFPITHDDFIRRNYYGKGIKGFLIDDVDMLLERMARGVQIGAITITPK